ncbi:T9SS type A sorting domain-containing protein [Flavobacterium lindanitolerans]|nr:T9SS type A sorting domain-containing protein [Flavobacterium lindanitolerans]
MAPNPAQDNVTVGYKLNDTNSAYLSIIGSYGANRASNNYILDVKNTEISIDISNYPSGLYTVALISNGKIVDTKKLIKK